MLFIYIRNLFDYLVDKLQTEINKFLDSNISVRLALMISLIVFLFFCYLFLWLPVISRFTTDVGSLHTVLQDALDAHDDTEVDDQEHKGNKKLH